MRQVGFRPDLQAAQSELWPFPWHTKGDFDLLRVSFCAAPPVRAHRGRAFALPGSFSVRFFQRRAFGGRAGPRPSGPTRTAIELRKQAKRKARELSLSSRGGRRGPGRGGPFCSRRALTVIIGLPLSPALSPLVPRGEREKMCGRRANFNGSGPRPPGRGSANPVSLTVLF